MKMQLTNQKHGAHWHCYILNKDVIEARLWESDRSRKIELKKFKKFLHEEIRHIFLIVL